MNSSETSELVESYDSDVGTFLCGLNLSKYISTFSEQAIDLDIFLTLTDEDLSFIGITDPEDREALLNGISNFKSHKRPGNMYPESNTLSDKDVLVIATNTLKQLSMLHAALAHTRLRLKATPVRNMILDQYSTATLLCILTSEAMSQNNIVKARLLGFKDLRSEQIHSTRYAVRRKIGWALFSISATITVATIFGLHWFRRPH